ncbi:hypothetical protein HPP92_009897 [Vanilla planifolia]|uniref:Uncharacterized protein n=1 Tax=Vanilla planifolia TaxID=51239 RepID=A0A835R8Q9_VANPL|nr:hypothetical protein HPP92_009897 [Vanilla planifolia]
MRALAPPLSRKHLFSFARFILLLGAATSTVLVLWLSYTLVDPFEDFPVRSNVADGTVMNPEISAVPPLGEPKENSRLMVKDNATLDTVEWERDQRAAFQRMRRQTSCATVEGMGKVFAVGSEKEIPKIKNVILRHFNSHGAARIRGLPPDEFCHEGFVLGKASEAGFGNEMYKILTAAALSIMLNRSLIIGQTRGYYPFGDFVSYTNYSFSLKEVKHLWRKHDCAGKYGRSLQIRFDNFEHPAETNVLCSDWRLWKQPIIWVWMGDLNFMKGATKTLLGCLGSFERIQNAQVVSNHTNDWQDNNLVCI